MSGLKVTRISTTGQEIGGGYALDATYNGTDVDVTSGLPLDGLLDVNVPTPADGDGIIWDDAAAEWVSVHALTESDVVALITPDIYACDSLTVIASKGAIGAGAHTDLHAVNGVTVRIDETNTTPGINVEAAYSGVDGLDRVFVHGYYTGNHTDMHVQLYNYDTVGWDTVITFPTGGTSMQLLSAAIADGSPYFDGGGNAKVRFYHASAGNPSHDLYLDFLAISHSTGSTGGLALNDLTDVDTTGKSDQDVLTWDNGTTTWIAAAAPSGSGIPATLIDAKGDLIVGSAADTAARLAVGGTNGHVLTVDSGQTLGVKWAAPAGGASGSFIGYDTAGGSWETMGTRAQYCKSVTLASAGVIASIDAYLRPSTDNIGGLAVTVLADNSGAPGVLLAAGGTAASGIYLSNSGSMPGAARWVSFGLGAYLASGTYWICVMGENGRLDIAYDGSGSDQYFTASMFLATGAYPAAWSITTGTRKYSIRARLLA